MKEILPNIFAVKVPEDTIMAGIYDKEDLPLALLCYVKDPKGMFKPGIPVPVYPIPPGSYTFLFCSNDATEEEASVIVRQYGLSHWADYGHGDNAFYDSALLSFQSLLRSHNLTGNYAIIRKN